MTVAMTREELEALEAELTAFHRDTGIWPPGRSVPLEMCVASDDTHARMEAFKQWRRAEKAEAERAQAKARCAGLEARLRALGYEP